jgi:hypothetical protein
VFDVGRRGFCDLSSMFSQKTSLYQDPNVSHTYSGGFDSPRESNSNSFQQQQTTDSYQSNSYQNDFFEQFDSKESRPKLKTQIAEAPIKAKTPKSSKPKENTSLLNSSPINKEVSREEALLGDLGGRPVIKKKSAKLAEDDVWNILNETSTKKPSSKRKQ